MRLFSSLYATLEQTTSTNAKVAAMADYVRQAPAADAAWAIFFLSGRRLLRLLPSRLLRQWTLEAADISEWLFDECYASVGDLAETMALLLEAGHEEAPAAADVPLHQWIARIDALRQAAEDEQRARVVGWWREVDAFERFVLNKMLTGELRVGVSQTLVVRALAAVSGLEAPLITHRLTGQWQPSEEGLRTLLAPAGSTTDRSSQPYPFCLAYPLESDPASVGEPSEWQVEWKWDGIRAQLIKRDGEVYIWSRGEELITTRFPEVLAQATALPDGCVLDGEIVAWRGEAPLPFATLQVRIGRRTLTRRVLDAAPARFIAYDLLELDGRDIREQPLDQRRASLITLLSASPGDAMQLSPVLEAASWDAYAELRQTSRTRGVEGFMLKRRTSAYGTGRRKGDWWKWKVDPFSVDAVLVYAQAGHGRRASLFTDYTFALWNDDELVPVAKAYSGLSNHDIEQLDRWVRAHTLERFGPVRRVPPVHVFEIAFENVQRSARHKSGVAVRFPRIVRWRTDKTPEEADRLETLEALIAAPSADGG